MLSPYEANSPETDLAVEFLVREGRGELTRQEAVARLWLVFSWDLKLWMNAKRPEEQLRADRRRILALCSQVAYLQNTLSRNSQIVLESLARELELEISEMNAADNAAFDALDKRRTNLDFLYFDLSNWDYTPTWFMAVCELYTSILEIYRVGSAEWHLARERFMDGFEERTIVLHGLSQVEKWREHGDVAIEVFGRYSYDERMNLLVQAVDIAAVDPKITRRKLRTLREFAKRIDLPESAVQEVLDARAAEREPKSE